RLAMRRGSTAAAKLRKVNWLSSRKTKCRCRIGAGCARVAAGAVTVAGDRPLRAGGAGLGRGAGWSLIRVIRVGGDPDRGRFATPGCRNPIRKAKRPQGGTNRRRDALHV